MDGRGDGVCVRGACGKASLLDLFDGRRQLIVYRAFFEPGVFGWPEHACRGCSMVADQVAHVAHLNARDTTLVFVSRAPQADIARLKARMGWKMPWFTITDSFDADFGVDEWHGTNVFYRDGERVFRTYFINNRGDEQMGSTWNYLDITPLGRQEVWENSPEGYPQTPTYKWWNWHDSYVADAAPDKKWVEVSDAGEAALRTTRARSHEPGLFRRIRRAGDPPECRRAQGGQLAGPRGVADFRHHGAADRCPWPGGDSLLARTCIAAERNGHDVPADERLPRGPMAQADPRERPPVKYCNIKTRN